MDPPFLKTGRERADGAPRGVFNYKLPAALCEYGSRGLGWDKWVSRQGDM